jgi:hypothetical protein
MSLEQFRARVTLIAHEACYVLWREESVAARATEDRAKEP